MKNSVLAGILFTAVLAAGCTGFEHRSTSAPTGTGMSALMGVWSSSTLIPSPSACSDFKWSVTEQSASSAKGSFSASCAGDLKFSGTAQGTLNGSVIAWSAQGTAIAPDLASCAVTLTGTAELAVDSIRVPYSGNTCLGPVSGVEVLRKR